MREASKIGYNLCITLPNVNILCFIDTTIHSFSNKVKIISYHSKLAVKIEF